MIKKLVIARRLFVVAAVIFIALAGWDYYIGDYALAFADVTIAWAYLTMMWMRRQWIAEGDRRGYWRYRTEIVSRCVESIDRGMSSREWFNSEIERATGITYIDHEDG